MLMRELKSDLEKAVCYQNETEKALNSLWRDNLTYTVKAGAEAVGISLAAGATGAILGLGNCSFYCQPVWEDQL